MKTWQKLPIGGKEKRLQMFFKKIKTWERFSEQKICKQKRKNDSLGGGASPLSFSHTSQV